MLANFGTPSLDFSLDELTDFTNSGELFRMSLENLKGQDGMRASASRFVTWGRLILASRNIISGEARKIITAPVLFQFVTVLLPNRL
jgi:hypothetical protein